MDPLSHAVTGALVAQSAAHRADLGRAALIGGLAGMSPDLDAFIRSETNPLLYLEFHRHFTHSLAFAPVLALLCAVVAWPLFRRGLSFARIWLFAFLGILPHGLLDACTSYGTVLWWPFSDTRVAWSNVAIIDPLYTLPLIVFCLVSWWRQRRSAAVWGVAWAVVYLLLGVIQRERAEATAALLAEDRGHTVLRLEAKPAVFSNFLFRTIYETENHYHVDAVRVGWFSRAVVYPGQQVPIPDEAVLFAGLEPGLDAYRGVERFRIFSHGLVYLVDGDPDVLGDLRYSRIPNSIRPLWTITVDRDRPDAHVDYTMYREIDDTMMALFRHMMLGRDPAALPEETSGAGEFGNAEGFAFEREISVDEEQ
ncbi:MAG: metal-dependent hydrolase [Puniceicoccaceae bacterium]|nr:MAG: metal-dependent hydrolase [Puniceicoccaceae bacterium]